MKQALNWYAQALPLYGVQLSENVAGVAEQEPQL
jgi:hypothetical protein